MKTRPIIVLLALACGLGAAATPPPKAAPAAPVAASTLAGLPPSLLVTRMKQIRSCLDEVFKFREAGNTPPDVRQNPFRLPGVPAASAQSQTAPGRGRATVPAETDVARLTRLASALVFGFLERPGQPVMLSYNSSSYKEGDNMRVTDPTTNTPYLLRVRKIAGRNVTFGLNNAEITVTK